MEKEKKYKSIIVELEINLDEEIIDILSSVLSNQAEPRPYIHFDEKELVFYFHTLDIRSLETNIDDLSSVDLFSSGKEASRHAAGLILNKILEAVLSIGSYGLNNGKRVYVGFNQERKVVDRKKKEKNRSQFFYAQTETFKKDNIDFPQEKIDSIACGDSAEVLKSLPDNCVDLVFTSPPYNFGLDYDLQDDAHKWSSYFDKLFVILDECIRTLKHGGRIIINIQPLFSDYIPSHHIISNFFMDRKLIWKGEILWEKNNYNCKYTSWGSWKSPSSPYLKYTWEFLEIYAKGTLRKEGKPDDADILPDEFKKWVVAKWSIAPERNMRKYGHPAMFPEELAIRAIKLFSFRGDTILDPFNGVGTTTSVAKKLGRHYFGIDISEEYCSVARERLDLTLF